MGKRKASNLSLKQPSKKPRTSADKKVITKPRKSSTKMVATFIRKVNQVYKSHANLQNAARMKKYMRGQFDFYGIKSPLRKELSREFLREELTNAQVQEFSKGLWGLPQRELQHFTMDFLQKHIQQFSLDEEFEKNFEFAEHLITTKSWWDTVDCLASHLVGHLVKQCPSKGKPEMERWIEHENMWLRRSAILHQLFYKDETDSELLFRFCSARAHEKEFFIQKSIGWALRQYARHDSAAVKAFVSSNKEKLSKLSYKEATKHIEGV